MRSDRGLPIGMLEILDLQGCLHKTGVQHDSPLANSELAGMFAWMV